MPQKMPWERDNVWIPLDAEPVVVALLKSFFTAIVPRVRQTG